MVKKSMRIDDNLSVNDIMKEISRRFKQYRIAFPMTQFDLSEKSMVSLSTIKRFENGDDISLSKMIQLMEALGLQGHLEVLIPDMSVRPSAYLEKTKPRQRVRKVRKKQSDWKWGNDK